MNHLFPVLNVIDMQQHPFIGIIEKYLAGEASEEEIQLLEAYYQRLGAKDGPSLSEEDANMNIQKQDYYNFVVLGFWDIWKLD